MDEYNEKEREIPETDGQEDVTPPSAEKTDPTSVTGEQTPSGRLDDFNYLIGEDGFTLQSDEESAEQPKRATYRPNKKKKKAAARNIKTVVWVLVICFISVSLAAFILLFSSEYLGIGLNKGGECVVEIDRGMTTTQIAAELKDAGAINSKLMFRIFSKLGGYDGTYKYGVYTFTNELGYKELAKMMQTEGAVAETVEVTIPERASIDDIIKILEEKGVCTRSDFRNAVLNGKYDFDFVDEIPVEEVYYKFEGYLFPDTYQFYCYDDSAECAELAIRKMLQNLDNKLTPQVRAKIKDSGYSIHQILTMASIVELEASAAPSEMSNVAAVFYNRLSWDEPHLLGSSPTADYPYGNGRYDTNKTEGLPPGPLCSPSENAILAAVSPTENFSATYFVTDSEMKFYYNNSLAAHNQTIASLKKQGKWLG